MKAIFYMTSKEKITVEGEGAEEINKLFKKEIVRPNFIFRIIQSGEVIDSIIINFANVELIEFRK